MLTMLSKKISKSAWSNTSFQDLLMELGRLLFREKLMRGAEERSGATYFTVKIYGIERGVGVGQKTQEIPKERGWDG